LERTPLWATAQERYHKIVYDGAALADCFVEAFLDAYAEPPPEIVLDLDATDDPVHGRQEGRFFHGYYRAYCYLPLYIFCGDHLLCARLRRADGDGAAGAVEELRRIVSQIRTRWPRVAITIRADSGFARDEIMVFCEEHEIDYVLGLARNARLEAAIEAELSQARGLCETTGTPARVYKDFRYRTHKTWSRERRVVGKAEHLPGKANPRFVVTSLGVDRAPAPRSTSSSTAPAVTWRTASKNNSSRSSPTGRARPQCAATSCACGWPRSPTCWSTRCGAWA